MQPEREGQMSSMLDLMATSVESRRFDGSRRRLFVRRSLIKLIGHFHRNDKTSQAINATHFGNLQLGGSFL